MIDKFVIIGRILYVQCYQDKYVEYIKPVRPSRKPIDEPFIQIYRYDGKAMTPMMCEMEAMRPVAEVEDMAEAVG